MLAAPVPVRAALVAALFVASGPAANNPPGLLPINPGPNGYFEPTLGPGAHETFALVVKNEGAQAATYPIYAAAASTGSSGGVAYSQEQVHPSGTSAWLELPSATVSLAPNASRQLEIGLTVPPGTAPGDYVTAIAAQSPGAQTATAPSGGQTKVALTTTSRVVVAVVVHVPGPRQAQLTVGQPGVRLENGGRQILDIPFVDSGNVLLKPHLSGTITSCSASTPLVTIDRQLDTFVPQTSVTYSYPLAPTILPAGCYRISMKADYSGGALGSFSGTFGVSAQTASSATPPNGAAPGAALRHAKPLSQRISVRAVLIGLAAVLVVLILARLVLPGARRRRRARRRRSGAHFRSK